MSAQNDIKEKELSCGCIIRNEKGQLLGCTPSGKPNNLDIPKGRIEQGETTLEAAIRECREETNIDLGGYKYKDLGGFYYLPKKSLHLYEFFDVKIESLDDLKCTSFYELNGQQVPEMVGYKWVDLVDIEKYFFKSMIPVLNSILFEEKK